MKIWKFVKKWFIQVLWVFNETWKNFTKFILFLSQNYYSCKNKPWCWILEWPQTRFFTSTILRFNKFWKCKFCFLIIHVAFLNISFQLKLLPYISSLWSYKYGTKRLQKALYGMKLMNVVVALTHFFTLRLIRNSN